jgi:hypothetical protein
MAKARTFVWCAEPKKTGSMAMTFKQGLSLEDPSILTNVKEFDEIVNTYIEDIFPQ